MKPDKLLIAGGRIIDPSQKLDLIGDILITSGKITHITKGKTSPPKGCAIMDAARMVVCPGLIDLHCHLREPGFENKETIATGTRAASRGGFTTVCCMPNTNPPLDTRGAVDLVMDKARTDGVVRVLPIGCITKGRDGRELVEMEELASAGVIGFSDDGEPVPTSRMMRQAMEYSLTFGLPVIDHCEDKSLSEGGQVNEGWIATRMGLQGIPAATEENAIARDLALARFTKARLHIAHVSAAESVELIRHAKERGVAVTAEVTPHHLTLTENRVMGKKQSAIGSHPSRIGPLPTDAYDTDAKVNPPLRTEEDRQALVQGLKDGIIDAIATDHAPHTWVDKTCEFGLAAFGISGLETALGALMGLVKDGEIDLTTLISKLTLGPAQILGARYSGLGTIMEGSVADITVFDPEDEWLVTDEVMASKGKNTPFEGCMLRGRAMATVIEGDVVHGAEHIRHGGGK